MTKAKFFRLIDSCRARDEQGQALLFVVVVLTIALSVGVSVSSRLLSTASRTARTDTAARAYAAAEGGVERFLAYPPSVLDDVMDGNCQGLATDSESGACIVVLNDGAGGNGDNVMVNAYVTVDSFTYTNEDAGSYEFNLPTHDVREINLEGYLGEEVTVCWNPVANDAYLFYTTYDSSGFIDKGGIISTPGAHQVQGFDTSDGCPASLDPEGRFTFGKTITWVGTRTGFRVYSLYDDAIVAVFPETSYDLPIQGHQITSIGRLSMPGEAEVAKKVVVYRPVPYLPSIFDFALYSEGGLN
jgi:hypothetical protein